MLSVVRLQGCVSGDIQHSPHLRFVLAPGVSLLLLAPLACASSVCRLHMRCRQFKISFRCASSNIFMVGVFRFPKYPPRILLYSPSAVANKSKYSQHILQYCSNTHSILDLTSCDRLAQMLSNASCWTFYIVQKHKLSYLGSQGMPRADILVVLEAYIIRRGCRRQNRSLYVGQITSYG